MVTIRTNPVGKGFQWTQSGRVNTAKTQNPSFVPSVLNVGKLLTSNAPPLPNPVYAGKVRQCPLNSQLSAPRPAGTFWGSIEHWDLGLELHSEHAACDLP
jgi:hypothetical protein